MELFELSRQVPFEEHRLAPPQSLVNQNCPFVCTSRDGTPGKMVIRYHTPEWAHVRCSNLECIYRPYSVKNPMDLSTFFKRPENPSHTEMQQYQKRIDVFYKWMNEEKTLVNAVDFAEAQAADAEKINSQGIFIQELTEPQSSLVPATSTSENLDLALTQQRYFLQQSNRYAYRTKKHTTTDSTEESDFEPARKRRRYRKRKKDPAAIAPVKPPSGKKRGRPKGFSPKKARLEAELAAQMNVENAPAESLEVIQLDDKVSRDKVNYYAGKPRSSKKSFSLKTAAMNLFGSSQSLKYNKARVLFIKALLLAGQVPEKNPTKKWPKKAPPKPTTKAKLASKRVPEKEKPKSIIRKATPFKASKQKSSKQKTKRQKDNSKLDSVKKSLFSPAKKKQVEGNNQPIVLMERVSSPFKTKQDLPELQTKQVNLKEISVDSPTRSLRSRNKV